MDMDGPPMEDTEFPYFVPIDCVTGNGYGRSDSLPEGTLAARSVFGNEFVYDGCNKGTGTHKPRQELLFTSKMHQLKNKTEENMSDAKAADF